MKNYSELIKARFENITGALVTVAKGLIYFKTDGAQADRPVIDDGTDVSQLMMEKHLSEARRDTKVQLDDAGTGNEIEGVLPYTKGGTQISSLTGKAGQALIVTPTEDGYEFGESGGGSLDFFYKEAFEINDAADMTTGDDPVFLGGAAALTGSIANNTGTPANGLRSLTYTQAAGSLNDYVAGEVFDVNPRNRGQFCAMTAYFNYDGNDGDIEFFAYDVTNAQILEGAAVQIRNTSGKYLKHEYYFNMPDNCAQMRWGVQVKVENAAAVLEIDDIEFKANPLTPTEAVSYQSISNIQNGGTSSPITQSGTFSGNNLFTFNDSLYVEGDNILAVGNFSGSDGLTLTATRKARVNGSLTLYNNGGTAILVDVFKMDKDGSTIKHISRATEAEAQTSAIQSSFSYDLEAGEFLLFSGALGYQNSATLTVNAQAEGKGVVVKNRTDSASVENVFSASILNPSGTPTIESQSVDFIEAVSLNSTGDIRVDYKPGIFTETPAVVAMVRDSGPTIVEVTSASSTGFRFRTFPRGSGVIDSDIYFTVTKQGADYIKETDKVYTVPVDSLTGNSVTLKGNDSRAIAASSEPLHFSGSGTGWVEGADGSTHTNGNYYTVQKNNSKIVMHYGIAISPGTTASPIGTDVYVNGSKFRRAGIDYLGGDTGGNWGGVVIFNRGELTAGDKISLGSFRAVTLANDITEHYLIISEEYGDRGTFLGTFGQPVAYVKDVKTSGTNGGDFLSGSWRTRTLNTLEGDTSFISLASNRFTLQAGSYDIEASAPAYRVNRHQVRLYDAPNAVLYKLGTGEFADNTTFGHTRSFVQGRVVLSQETSLELQHIGQTTESGTGFGISSLSGSDNVFAQVKITKVR